MNILIVAYYFPPIVSGGSIRPEKMTKFLRRLGHEVTVLTHSYRRSELNSPGLIRIRDISHNNDRLGWNALAWLVLRVTTELLNRLGLGRSIFSWWRKRVLALAPQIMAMAKPELIIATYPPEEVLEIGLRLSTRYDIPLLADFRDGLIFESLEKGRLKRYRGIKKRLHRMEQEVARVASAITTVSEPISRHMAETYQLSRVMTIYNGFDPDDFNGLPTVEGWEPNKFNIVYTGQFSRSDQGCTILYFIQALEELTAENPGLVERLRIHLVGRLSRRERKWLKRPVQRGMVICHGVTNRVKALGFQKQADVLLLITAADRGSVVTAKFFEYLFSGRPILALTPETVLAELIRETRSGWVVHPHHPKEIKNLLHRIISDPVFFGSIRFDPEAAAQYASKIQIEKLARLIGQVVDPKTGSDHP